MFGFIFGTVCLFGLFAVARAGRSHHRYGGCHTHHGWGSRRWRGGPGGVGKEQFARAAGEVLKRRLRIDAEQEPIVDHALRDARTALEELGKELKETRTAVADALRGESVDDAALAAAFARQDDAVGRARREVVSAMKQVHAVLDEDQRKRAADLLTAASGRWA